MRLKLARFFFLKDITILQKEYLVILLHLDKLSIFTIDFMQLV
jgi:hypothetical protein